MLVQGAHVIEDLAMKHPNIPHDRPAAIGHIGSIQSQTTIPVSLGLANSALQVHGTASSLNNTNSAHKRSIDTSCVESVHQALARAVNLGLLDVDSLEFGATRLSCPHAGLPKLKSDSSSNSAVRIAQKYAASIAHLVCSLYCTAPQAAAAVLRQFSDMFWECLIQMRCRRSIECLYDLFPLLRILYHTSAIETLLVKALTAARIAGPAWYAKVRLLVSRLEYFNLPINFSLFVGMGSVKLE